MSLLVILFLIIKNTVYGLSIFFTGSLTESTDILDILSIRFLLSFAVLFLLRIFKIIKINIKVKDLFKSDKSNTKSLLLTGIFEPILYMLFETLGVSMTTGITAGIILASSPIFSCIFEWLILKEKSTLWQKVFLGIGIVGVVYIGINTNTSGGENTLSGILFMLAAVISGVLFTAFSRKSSRHFKPFDITYITCFEGALIFNFINIVRHLINGDILSYFMPLFNTENLIGFLYLSVLSTIVATAMNNYALSRAKISVISAFGGVSTLVTIAAGIILDNETFYLYQAIGVALIFIRMIGVTVIDLKNKKSDLISKNI